jgi:hypothetical protein
MEREKLVNPGEARAVLDEVVRLRAQTRRERQAFWFPLLVFALVVLISAWFYPPRSALGVAAESDSGVPAAMLGGQLSSRSSAPVYWLIAIPAGYLLTAAYYLWRARRRGVVSPWRIWALSGVGLFALVVFLVQYSWGFLPGDLAVRGLLPLLAIAVGFAVLAATHRSLEFGIFAALFFALALTANLYDMSNLTERVGIRDGQGVYMNNVFTGVALMLASAWFALWGRGWRVAVTVRIVRPTS